MGGSLALRGRSTPRQQGFEHPQEAGSPSRSTAAIKVGSVRGVPEPRPRYWALDTGRRGVFSAPSARKATCPNSQYGKNALQTEQARDDLLELQGLSRQYDTSCEERPVPVGGSGSISLVYLAQTDRQPQGVASSAATASVVLLLFLLCLIQPGYFHLGDLRLSPTRILLLAVFVPLLLRLLTGGAGRIQVPDVLLVLFMVWMVVTLLYHHGLERFPYAMVSVVELLGGYLIGRVLVRNITDFTLFFRYAFWVLVALSPVVLVELLTDRNLLQELSQILVPTYTKAESSYGRIGLNRVMAGFEHPILYGLFCAALFGPILAILGRGKWASAALVLFLGFMTFASLSSAPLLALAIQLGLMVWAWMTGNRWWLLFGLAVSAYVTIDLLSNRTPVTILINYITFDPGTAWTRILIWDYGSAEMWRHPIFGIGLNDWTRPHWLTGSVDNFWLVLGMRHGVVGMLLMIGALASGLWGVMRVRGLNGKTALLRQHYVLALIATYTALCTVHMWGGSSSFIMLLVGAGAWFVDAASHPSVETATPMAKPGTPHPYSRFPSKVRQRTGEMSPYLSRAQRMPQPRPISDD